MIYLASRSPRRRELLAQIGVKFEPLLFREGRAPGLRHERGRAPGEQPDDYVRRVTRLKAERRLAARGDAPRPARACRCSPPTPPSPSAGEILGKPADRADAERILRLLSGTQHRVLTAVAVAFEERFEMAVSESLVTFGALDEARIAAYVAVGRALRQGRRLRHPGPRRRLRAAPRGQLLGVMGLPLSRPPTCCNSGDRALGAKALEPDERR